MRRAACLLALLSVAAPDVAGTAPVPEAQVEALFAHAVRDPLEARLFLRAMPKGGDLHNHLSGAIWAEDYIAWARADGYCLGEDGVSLAPPPAAGCAKGRSLEQGAGDDTGESDRLIDALSTRGWQMGIGRNDVSGHTQFFRTFGRFGAVAGRHAGDMLAALRQQAAFDRLTYLEIDHNTDVLSLYALQAGEAPMVEADIPATFAAEIAGVEAMVVQGSAQLSRDEAEAARALACDSAPVPACTIRVHYLFQALRALPPRMVFRSLMLGFAAAAKDPRWVGVNIVMPEDAPVALADYDLHMAMIRFLATRYPQVRRSLHAGELAFGAVPPRDLKDHIAKAVAAGAQRIGHGVDIAYEEDAEATLRTMARRRIAVEINLTSNDVILGVKGAAHPVNLYRSRGVPIVLSTDDQGVLRIDMTAEYVRAAREQHFTYRDLKQAARTSLELSFLSGASIWADGRVDVAGKACATLASAPCRALASTSEKAAAQLDLETRLAAFERDTIATARTQSMSNASNRLSADHKPHRQTGTGTEETVQPAAGAPRPATLMGAH